MRRERAEGKPASFYIVLRGIAKKEDSQFASYCPDLGVASCGNTPQKALENLGDAIEAYLKDLEDTGEIYRVLKERNIPLQLAPPSQEHVHVDVPVDSFATVFGEKIRIPARLAAAAMLQ